MSLKSRYFFLKSRYIYEITFLFVSLFHVENLPSFFVFFLGFEYPTLSLD